jgi:hypothetical protein
MAPKKPVTKPPELEPVGDTSIINWRHEPNQSDKANLCKIKGPIFLEINHMKSKNDSRPMITTNSQPTMRGLVV